MGYAHAWRDRFPPGAVPAEALAIIVPLLSEAAAAGLIQRDFNDPSPPELGPVRIIFNGVGQAGHDTFVYSADGRPDGVWTYWEAFCKTERKPYDILVQKTLLTLAYFSASLYAQSDGTLDSEDWREARKWAEEQGFAGMVYHERTFYGPKRAAAMERAIAKSQLAEIM